MVNKDGKNIDTGLIVSAMLPDAFNSPDKWALCYDEQYDVSGKHIRVSLQATIADIERDILTLEGERKQAMVSVWRKATALYERMTGEKWIPPVEKKINI